MGVYTTTEMPEFDVEAIVARHIAKVRFAMEGVGPLLKSEIIGNIIDDDLIDSGDMLESVTDPVTHQEGPVIETSVSVPVPYAVFVEVGFIHYQSGELIPGTHFASRAATVARDALDDDLVEALR